MRGAVPHSSTVLGVDMSGEDLGADFFVRLRADLLIIGDSVLTDRHHASNGNYDPRDPQNQIGGLIPSFSLSGWLRHGMERVVQEHGATACHPGESNANFKKDGVYTRDLDAGYHEKGTCLDNDKECVILDLFGGFDDRPGKVMRRPVKFSPVRSGVDYTRGQAEGHYRRLNRNIVSRNEEDGRQPLRNLEVDAVANLDGCWQLVFRETKPEFIGLLAEAVEYLDTYQTDFMHQLGGARNFGGGIIDCALINPLYETHEFRRVFDRSKRATTAMQAKDEEWAEECLPKFRTALRERIEADR